MCLNFWNPRIYSKNKHGSIDDRPYGGGHGMLCKIEPFYYAIKDAKKAAIKLDGKNSSVISVFLSPQGRILNQKIIMNLVFLKRKIILVCARYEGIDERFILSEIDEEWSIGDYILSGGELPAMVFLDSIARCIPGVLNSSYSVNEDSFVKGLLEHPYYTRPENFKNMKVPKVLLSGNHQIIQKWKIKQSLGRTWLKKPYLLKNKILTEEEKILLNEFQLEYKNTKKKY